MNTIRSLPPGDYYLGDPCYTLGLDQKVWGDFCTVLNTMDPAPMEPKLFIWGIGFVGVWVTRTGDCSVCSIDYLPVTEKPKLKDYGIDSGLFGLVSANMVRGEPEGVQVIRFTDPVTLSRQGKWANNIAGKFLVVENSYPHIKEYSDE